MSNIHILDKDVENKTVNCVFHVASPTGNNAAGKTWYSVIKSYLKPVSVIEDNVAENTLIENGEVIEVVRTFRFSTIDITNAQRLAELQAFYDSRSVSFVSDLESKLNFYGKEI